MSKKGLKYPAKSAGTCIVCEDIRTEVTGKLIMIGVYPGETIRFFSKPTDENPGRLNMAISFWFRGARGEFLTKISVTDPQGEKIVDRELGTQNVEDGKVMSFVVGVQGAEFHSHGKFQISLSLNDRIYEFPLIVTYSDGVDGDLHHDD